MASFVTFVKYVTKPNTTFSLNHVHDTKCEIPIGFTKEEKVNYVRQALKMVGLTEKFAPLVVMCGHSSQSTNNPYAAALECGACGGAAGGFNARVFATLCNLPEVREALSAEGIKIPEDTILQQLNIKQQWTNWTGFTFQNFRKLRKKHLIILSRLCQM